MILYTAFFSFDDGEPSRTEVFTTNDLDETEPEDFATNLCLENEVLDDITEQPLTLDVAKAAVDAAAKYLSDQTEHGQTLHEQELAVALQRAAYVLNICEQSLAFLSLLIYLHRLRSPAVYVRVDDDLTIEETSSLTGEEIPPGDNFFFAE